MRLMRSLPSFTILVSIVALGVLAPLLAFSLSQLDEVNTELETSIRVQQSAERIQVLIQLAPALGQEQLSSVWVGAAEDAFREVEQIGGGSQLLPNLGDSVEADRERVDQLALLLGDGVLSQEIMAVRVEAASGDLGFFDYEDRYDQILARVESELSIEIRELSKAVGQSRAGEVVQAARVGEAAASLQMIAVGLGPSWAQLHATDLLPASLRDTMGFADRLAVFNERSDTLERVAPPASEVGAQWFEVRTDANTLRMRQRYLETVRRFGVSGVDPTVEENQIPTDMSTLGLGETLLLAAEVNGGLDDATTFSTALTTVVATALDELDAAADRAVHSASTARNSAIRWTLALAAFVIGGALAMIVTVGRPIRRMAYTAEQLSHGRLDTKLDEVGPTEVRLGARALNNAIASIRIAEAQALALAEERLDDEVLEQRAPGELGKSLHAAVHRLAGSIAERDEAKIELEHKASHDHLTKLPNRSAVMRHLSSAMARSRKRGETLAVLFLDIDDFKSINDKHGHHSGDAVLQEVANRLMESLRGTDFAGRLGGDEFIVIAESLTGVDLAITVSERILSEVNRPIEFEGVTFHPKVSIGIGLSEPTAHLTPDQLMRDADSAVYRAKGRGKARVEVYDENVRFRLRERQELEKAITHAIEHDEFFLHYQPYISAQTSEVFGVEALVRWDRADVGIVHPDDFIPAAERTDLIIAIDQWVIDSAAAQVAHWSHDPQLRNLEVSINISARHLGSETLCDDVRSAIERHGIDPSRLVLELTETALLGDISSAARELAMLREVGVKVALDDYGTGFMSLAQLRQLPVDVLKIDRSFIAQMESETDRSLIRLIIETAHVLGMSVTAEGVETQRQADSLSTMSVDVLQGFFYGRAISAIHIARLVAELTRNENQEPDVELSSR